MPRGGSREHGPTWLLSLASRFPRTSGSCAVMSSPDSMSVSTAGISAAGCGSFTGAASSSRSYMWAATRLFDHDVAFGERPPLLANFWDESAAADGSHAAVRKVFRIRGEQSTIQD